MNKCNLCELNNNGIWLKQYKYWNFGVCPNQHTLGSLVIILNQHKELFSEITNEEMLELKEIIVVGQKILDIKFKPDWYNVQQNGNWEHHLHIHIIPRYKNVKKYNDRKFVDKTYGQPVIYTAAIEPNKYLTNLTSLLKQYI